MSDDERKMFEESLWRAKISEDMWRMETPESLALSCKAILADNRDGDIEMTTRALTFAILALVKTQE
jgi:hypothetical protein